MEIEMDKLGKDVEAKEKDNENKIQIIFDELNSKTGGHKDTVKKIAQEFDVECDTINGINATDLCERLRNETEKCINVFKRENINCIEVLEKCSGGGCLKGFFYKDETDITACDKTLIGLKKEASFQFNRLPERKIDFEFEDTETHSRYLELVASHGFSFAQNICASIPLLGIIEESQYKHGKEEDSSLKETKTIKIYGTVTSVVVPVAQWEPHIQDLCLSENAKDSLKKIEKILDLREFKTAKSLCEVFFKIYGTHVCVGNIHFGGIQNFTTILESSTSLKKSKMKEIVSSEHTGYLSGLLSKFGIAKVSGTFSGEYMKQSGNFVKDESHGRNLRTSSTTTVIGGPSEVLTTFLWKEGLIKYNTTWAMIDRQCQEKRDFMGVWNLILSESDQFNDPEMLYHFLLNEWKKTTGLVVDDDGQLIVWKEKRFSAFIEKIRCTHLKRSKDDTFEMMRLISENVSDLRKKGQIQIWMKHLREENSICKGLIKSTKEIINMTNDDRFSSWYFDIFSDIDDIEFEGKKDINIMLNLLRQRKLVWHIESKDVDIESICEIITSKALLQKTLENPDEITITNLVGMHATSWLESLRKSEEHSHLILLIAVLASHNYNYVDNYFECQVSLQNVHQIALDLKQSYEEYAKISSGIKSQHAYCILLLMSKLRITCDCEESRQTHFLNIWDKLKTDLKVHNDILLLMNGIRTDFIQTEIFLKRLEEEAELNVLLRWDYFETCKKQPVENCTMSKQLNVNITSELRTLLSRLYLNEFYENKIRMNDVLQIDDMEETTMKTLPWKTLQKIVSLDFCFRETLLAELEPMDEALDWFGTENEEERFVDATDELIHPSDLFCAIYLCSDSQLKGLLVRKMALLKFAIPFTFSMSERCLLYLWPLRSICLGDKIESAIEDGLIYVTFARYGTFNTISKSSVLNELLSPIKHNIFHHRNCALGKRKRKISNGMIELVMHDIGDKGTAFLNLRGDASDFFREANLAFNLSRVIVVFLHWDCIEIFKKQLAKIKMSQNLNIILLTLFPTSMSFIEARACLQKLFTESEGTAKNTKIIPINDFRAGELIDAQTLQKQLGCYLFPLLKTIKSDGSLDKTILELTDRYLFDIDEDEVTCKVWENCARNFYDYICSNNSDREGSSIFSNTPLQGEDLWKKWSRISKEMHKEPQHNSYDTDETKKKMLLAIRRKQILVCNSVSQTTAKFVENLISAEKEEALHYFLSWFEILLNNHSTKCSATMRQMGFFNKQTIPDVTNKQYFTNFGLENLFREMAQIYEAFMFCSQNKMTVISERTLSVLHHMPVIMAKLLLSGKEVEVFDGFAGNIPLLWIEAIFQEVIKLIPDKKVVSLSVVGIQSSGKSTMLNTMFGVEFRVRAGKCTRGIYMKLLPIKKRCNVNNVDYIMIYDTEGLRAPENNEDYHHDNELSTMVIGMADIVVVNIMGEAMSDMINVLQIVVYALVRIRLAYRNMNIYPTCLFVHQNTIGGEAIKEEMRKISERLDQVAKAVADREHMTGVTNFKDIIKFDPDINVMHVSNLWLGKPPTAPVSCSYSEDVASVKSKILHLLLEDEPCTLSVYDMFERIQSTWYAVQSEDFVFSFRNSREIKAYIVLESKIRSIFRNLETCHFHSLMNIGPALCRGAEDKMDETVAEILQIYLEKMSSEKNSALENLLEYIKNSNFKKIMENWRVSKKMALEEEISNLHEEFKIKLQNAAHVHKVKSSYSDSNIENEALKAVSSLAEELKSLGNSDEKNMEYFNKFWINFLHNVAPKTPQKNLEYKNNTLLKQIKLELSSLFQHHSTLLRMEMEKCDVEHEHHTYDLSSGLKNGSFNIESSFWKGSANFISKGAIKLGILPRDARLKTNFLNILEKITEQIKDKLNKLSVEDIEFDINVYKNLISIVTKGVRENNQYKKREIVITHHGEISFALYVSRFLYAKFCRLNESFDSKHSFHAWLSLKKEKTRKYFICIMKERKVAERVAIMVCEDIKVLIAEKLQKIIPEAMVSSVKTTFFITKYQFLCDFLTEMAKFESFENYLTFLKDPANGAKVWLNHTVNAYLFNTTECKQSRFNNIVENKIEEEIKESLNIASGVQQQTLKSWIKTFCKKMEKLAFESGYVERLCKNFENVEVQTFKDIFLKNLQKLKCELIETYKSKTTEEKESDVEKIVIKVFKGFWGCEEHCPLCGEPCQYNQDHLSSNIPHRCIQHRPEALKGIRNTKTQKLVFETCNWLVKSNCTIQCSEWCSCVVPNNSVYHPYKEYKKYMPTWDIAPSSDMSGSQYWCWFVVKFHEDLQKLYNAKAADIPESWRAITKQNAIESIRRYIQDLSSDK